MFGGSGAPVGMFLITGSGCRTGVLPMRLIAPMLSGPCRLTLLPPTESVEFGWHQKEPWNLVKLLGSEIAAELFEARATSVSIWLFPDEPCQLVAVQPATAQTARLLPLSRAVPATSSAPTPV